MKMPFSFKTPIGYAIAGSFFLHIILVSIYGTLLASENVPPPPPPKKFKIEMVVKKLKPIKKVQVKEKKIIKPKIDTPLKIKKSRPARSAQKIRKKEIALQPVSQMLPAQPKMVEKNNTQLLKKSFQMARADISANAVVPRPHKIEKLQASNIITSKVQPSSPGRAKPADISPLPRPVENVRLVSNVTSKETSFHASAVGFAPIASKPKSVSVASFSSNGDRTTARTHDDRRVIAHGLPHARAVTVAKTRGADQKRAMKFSSGQPSRSISPGLAAIRPFVPEFESVTAPERAAKLYGARMPAVATNPVARKSIAPPPSSRDTENNMKVGVVQKGELVASATFPSPRPVPDIVDPGVLDDYLGALQKLIGSAKRYPETARKSGREGKVTVQFTVMKNGAVKNIQLMSKTSYSDLNEEAIEAVKRAAPFSGLPEEIGKPFLDIVLPFRFKLNE
jgi:TonB family protein